MASSVVYQRKLALVIGINNYRHNPLKYCINDATDLKTALERINFKVSFVENCDLDEFKNIVDTFTKTIRHDDLVLFYFAGHGQQSNDENYLLPSDYDYDHRETEHDYMRKHAVSVKYIMKKINDTKCRITIYLFDCCRNSVRVRGGNTGQGLLLIPTPLQTLIVYACAPGEAVQDETYNDRNGSFIEYLKQHIGIPNNDIEEIMRNTSRHVNKQTSGFQLPYRTSCLTDKVFLITNNEQEVKKTNSSLSPPTYTNARLQRIINEKKDDVHIDLSYKKLTNEDMEIVSYYLLRNNTTLEHLSLAQNQIGPQGMKYLSNALQNNKTLTELYLSVNQIGDEGVQYLSDALQNNETLKEIYLYNNKIEDKGRQLIHKLQNKKRNLDLIF